MKESSRHLDWRIIAESRIERIEYFREDDFTGTEFEQRFT
jgi:hypothetical protein